MEETNLDDLQDSISSLSFADDEEEILAPVVTDSVRSSPYRSRSAAIADPTDLQNRSPSRVTTSNSRKVSRNRISVSTPSTGNAPRSKRPDLNREALSATLPTPPSATGPLKPAKTVEELEEEKKKREMRKASEALRKKLLQESALSSSSLYRARRCSVLNTGKIQPLTAVQVEVETMRSRSSTAGAGGDLPFTTQKFRLFKMLQNTLSDSWRLDLFKRFLQEKHKENLLELYESFRDFHNQVESVEALSSDVEKFNQAREDLRSRGRDICNRFGRDNTVPDSVRLILRDSSYLMLVPLSNSTCEESVDDWEVTETDALSDDSSDEEPDLFVSELDSDAMELLGTDDPTLLRRPVSQIKTYLSPTKFQSPEPTKTKKIIERFTFFLAERKIFNILLDDLFSDFLCSHNQVHNLNRSFLSSDNSEKNHSETETEPLDESAKTPEEPQNETVPSTDTNDDLPDIEYSETENGKKVVDACTFSKCIEIISTTGIISDDFHFSTVVTFSYFSTFSDLIQKLREIFATKTAHLTGEGKEYETEKKKILLPITIRVTSVLKQLVEIHIEDFRRKPEDYKKLIDFVTSDLKSLMDTGATTLKEFIIKKMTQVDSKQKQFELQFNSKPPKPKISRSFSTTTIDQVNMHLIHPLELARQLAIIHHQLYRAINVEECLHMRWTKSDKLEKAPNVIASIHHFCDVGNWVTSVIVQELDLAKREQLLSKFISAAYESFTLKNYNGAMAIISGLQNHCVFRLKNTWNELSDKAWDMWEELKEIFKCDQNFASLRAVNAQASLPAVPYLGMYLSDLTFIDNEANFVDDKKRMINFVKMQYVGNIIRKIEKYQQGGYCLKPVPLLQEYLRNLIFLEEKEMYPWSSKCEERRANNRPSSDVIGKEKKAKRSAFKLRKSTSKKSISNFFSGDKSN